MDKLRAIEYFSRAVQTGTLAGAARHFDVSNAAVTQLIGALERALGTVLFHRSNRGLSLTPDGERYYATAQTLLGELEAVESGLGGRGTKLRGTLSVGLRGSMAQYCVLPNLPRFFEQQPELELVLKPVEQISDFDAQEVDVAVLTGWPPDGDFVVRQLAQTRNLVCASPAYWSRRGRPASPDDLAAHDCLVMRSSGGVLLDRWLFEKDGVQRAIDVRTRMLSHQVTWIVEAACAGCGVIRVGDMALAQHLASGMLEPVLTDWQALEAPQHFALYRPAQRRSKRVRVFVDFLVELFAELELRRPVPASHAGARMPRPDWFGHGHGRQSAYVARRARAGRASHSSDRT